MNRPGNRAACLVLMVAMAVPSLGGEAWSPRVKALAGSQWDRVESQAGREALSKEAETLLAAPVETIVEKRHRAASGDPHDYASIGIYWWPNPLTKGKPYIHHDGKVNPERMEYDHPRLIHFSKTTLALALAYAATGEERFAARAREWLRAWLLDEKSRMNPHFTYAQAWPGLKSGTPFGIIEGWDLAARVPAAVLILKEGGQLSGEEWAGISAWFTALREWYETSDHGREIDAQKNNICTWYDVQRVSYALLEADDEAARRIVREAVVKRLGAISSRGEMPAELARTKAWSYCCYHLRALMTLAALGEVAGAEDFWRATGSSGGSIRAVLEFMLPYMRGEKVWDYPQAGGWNATEAAPLFQKAAEVYGDPRYAEAAAMKKPAKKPAAP